MQLDRWLSRSQEPALRDRQHPRSPAQREALDETTPDEEAPDENLTQPDVNALLAAFRKAVDRLAGKVARLTSLPDKQQPREQPAQASPQTTEPPFTPYIAPYNDPLQHVEPAGLTTTIGLAFGKIQEINSNHRVLASSYPHGGPQQNGAASREEPQRILTSANRGTANKLWDPGPDKANPEHSTPRDTPPTGNAISAQPHAPLELKPDELGRGDRADTAHVDASLVDNDLDATARTKKPPEYTTNNADGYDTANTRITASQTSSLPDAHATPRALPRRGASRPTYPAALPQCRTSRPKQTQF